MKLDKNLIFTRIVIGYCSGIVIAKFCKMNSIPIQSQPLVWYFNSIQYVLFICGSTTEFHHSIRPSFQSPSLSKILPYSNFLPSFSVQTHSLLKLIQCSNSFKILIDFLIATHAYDVSTIVPLGPANYVGYTSKGLIYQTI